MHNPAEGMNERNQENGGENNGFYTAHAKRWCENFLRCEVTWDQRCCARITFQNYTLLRDPGTVQIQKQKLYLACASAVMSFYFEVCTLQMPTQCEP